ncbi:hypothetical protein ACLK1T_08235 [Escherichia coli]
MGYVDLISVAHQAALRLSSVSDQYSIHGSRLLSGKGCSNACICSAESPVSFVSIQDLPILQQQSEEALFPFFFPFSSPTAIHHYKFARNRHDSLPVLWHSTVSSLINFLKTRFIASQ